MQKLQLILFSIYLIHENAREPSSVHEIVNQVIRNNKFLCVDKKSVYRTDIADEGFCKIWDYILLIMYNLTLNKVFSL